MGQNKAVNPDPGNAEPALPVTEPEGEATDDTASFADLDKKIAASIAESIDWTRTAIEELESIRNFFLEAEADFNNRIASPGNYDFPTELTGMFEKRTIPKKIGTLIEEVGKLKSGMEASLEGYDIAMQKQAEVEEKDGDQTTFADTE